MLTVEERKKLVHSEVGEPTDLNSRCVTPEDLRTEMWDSQKMAVHVEFALVFHLNVQLIFH